MTSWKITLPCNKAEAEAVEANDCFANWDEPPVLLASEPDEDKPNEWELTAYSEEAPSAALIAALRALTLSRADAEPHIEQLGDEDWVTMSQAGIEPISAGRFYVRTPRYPPVAGTVDFIIDAGLAFGTGQHATTSGCLWALDTLATEGAVFSNILDLGTGTGLLAFAALALWPEAKVAASDIDPISIEVSGANAAVNHIALGESTGAVKLIVADGMDAPALADRAPYNLIVANVLAQPLIDMAEDIAGAVMTGGRLILSGLLVTQAEAVAAAYTRYGMRLVAETHHGDWGVLLLQKPST